MTRYVLTAVDVHGRAAGQHDGTAPPEPARAAALGDLHDTDYVLSSRDGGGPVTLFGRDADGSWWVVAADVDPDTAQEARLWFDLTRHYAGSGDEHPLARVPEPDGGRMTADGARAAVAAWIRDRGLDHPVTGLAADRFAAGWSVYAPVEVDDSDPMAFLDLPVGRSVFLVGDLGRVKEVPGSLPPAVASAMFAAEEAFVRRRPEQEEFLHALRDQVLELDTAADGPGAIASFTVDGMPPDVAAARASGMLAPIVQQVAQLGPREWDRLTAVFSCTSARETARVRFWNGDRYTDVRVPEQIALLVRRQRHLAAAMPAGPWWRLLVTVTRTGGGARTATEYDYGDEPLPKADLLAPGDYRADLAAYPRASVPAWLTAHMEGNGRAGAGPSAAGTGSAPPPDPGPAGPAAGGAAADEERRAALGEHLRRVGAEASLGQLWGVYPPALLTSSRLGGCAVVAGICALLGVVMLATGDALGAVVLVVALVLLLYVARGSAANGRVAPTGAATFEDGAVFVDKRGQVQVFRWRETSVVQRIVDHRRNGVYTHTTYRYELTAADGRRLTVGQSSNMPGLVNPERWGPEIQQGVTRAQLPRVLRTLESGGTVDFGPIRLERGTVTARGRTVPWSAIEQVRVERGHVSLRVEGRWFSLVNTEVSSIPNFFVFRAAAESLRRSARGE